MEISELDNKKIALLLWAKENGDDDVAVFSGMATLRNGKLFLNLEGNPNFEILPVWLSRVKKASEDVKGIVFDAEYCLSLSVGKKTTKRSDILFENTGLKWPI